MGDAALSSKVSVEEEAMGSWVRRGVPLGGLMALWIMMFGVSSLGETAASSQPPGAADSAGMSEAAVAAPEILQVTLRRVSDEDPGTAQVYLHNGSRRDIRLKELVIDGAPVMVDSAASPVMWYSLFPPAVPGGDMGLIAAKLKQRPEGILRLLAKFDNGTQISTVIGNDQVPLRISSVGFPGNKRLFLYVENQGEEARTVIKVSHDLDETWRDAGIAPVTIPPGDKMCVVVKLSEDVPDTTYVGVHIQDDAGGACCALVRALHVFQIALEDESSSQSLFMPFSVKSYGNTQHLGPTFWCPAHAHGSWANAAREILMMEESRPTIPVLDMCRCDRLLAWPIFAETASICRTNVTQPPMDSDKRKPTDSIRWVAQRTYACSSPRPFHATVGVSNESAELWSGLRFPVVEEVRLGVFIALANGAKGLCYRNRDWKRQSPSIKFLRGLTEIDREVIGLAPYLVAADIVRWVSVSQDKVTASGLLYGDRTVLIFLTNEDYTSVPEPRESPFSYTPKENVEVSVSIPEGYCPISLIEAGGVALPFSDEQHPKHVVRFTVPKLELTDVSVLNIAPNGESATIQQNETHRAD